MNTTIIQTQVRQYWKSAHRLALLAAFEDSTTGTRVKEFYQGLSRDVGPDCRVVEHVWLFSTLRLREMQEIAAEDASQSDLIIISAHQAVELPQEVRTWIELWLRLPSRHPAILLALLDPEYEQSPTAVQNYLQEVARRGGMEFLVEPGPN